MASRLPLSSPDAESDADLLVLDPATVAPDHDQSLAGRAPSAAHAHLTGQADRRRRRRRSALGVLIALVPAAGILAFWQVLAQTHVVSSLLLPTPVEVARVFWHDFVLNTPGPFSLWPYVGTTLAESVIGFALGTAVALPLGYGIARYRWFALTAQPYVAASQALPAVALAPLLMIWLGYGLPPIIALCALIIFFPMVVNTVAGLRAIDPDVIGAGRVDGANRWQLLRSVELPLALPSILAGMRTSLTLSITGAVVGEFVLGDQGLGGLLIIARGNNDAALEFATLFVLALLAAAFYGAARLSERLFSYLEA